MTENEDMGFNNVVDAFTKTYLPGGEKPLNANCPRWLFFVPALSWFLAWVLAMWYNGWAIGAPGFGGILLIFIHLGICFFYGIFGAIRIVSKKASVNFLIKASLVNFLTIMVTGVLALVETAFEGDVTIHFIDFIIFGLGVSAVCAVVSFIDLKKRSPLLGAINWGLMCLSCIASVDLLNIMGEYGVTIYVISAISFFLILVCAALKVAKVGEKKGTFAYSFFYISVAMATIGCFSGGSVWALVAYGAEVLLSFFILANVHAKNRNK